MTQSGLFAHLALRLGADPEVVATEALSYILARSTAARTGLLGACAIACPNIPRMLDIRRIPADTGAAGPGLIGVDDDGSRRLLMLPKFWNGLQERQPVEDLRLLSADRSSALVVVAPSGRFTPLWAELRRRCRLSGIPVHGDHAAGNPIRWTRVGQHQTLILASWTSLLAGVQTSVANAGDEALAREADQLASLCQLLDSDAFLPLSAEDLTAMIPRRLSQLLGLADDLAVVCERRGIGQITEGARDDGPGSYSRSLRVGRATFVLTWSVPLWATLRETPFWLRIVPASAAAATVIEARLRPLSNEVPPRLLRASPTGHPLVPLFPLVGAERDAVLHDLMGQVEEVARLLGEAPTGNFGAAGGHSVEG
jgi:hypothetical protein